jgi:hypothetical protein
MRARRGDGGAVSEVVVIVVETSVMGVWAWQRRSRIGSPKARVFPEPCMNEI